MTRGVTVLSVISSASSYRSRFATKRTKMRPICTSDPSPFRHFGFLHAANAASVSGLETNVSQVAASCNLAQILWAIINTITVTVVDIKTNRVFASVHVIHDPMDRIANLIYLYTNVGNTLRGNSRSASLTSDPFLKTSGGSDMLKVTFGTGFPYELSAFSKREAFVQVF